MTVRGISLLDCLAYRSNHLVETSKNHSGCEGVNPSAFCDLSASDVAMFKPWSDTAMIGAVMIGGECMGARFVYSTLLSTVTPV